MHGYRTRATIPPYITGSLRCTILLCCCGVSEVANLLRSRRTRATIPPYITGSLRCTILLCCCGVSEVANLLRSRSLLCCISTCALVGVSTRFLLLKVLVLADLPPALNVQPRATNTNGCPLCALCVCPAGTEYIFEREPKRGLLGTEYI